MWTCVGGGGRVQAVREGGREGEGERDRDSRRRERETVGVSERERRWSRVQVSKPRFRTLNAHKFMN